jgi:hypothetical protein
VRLWPQALGAPLGPAAGQALDVDPGDRMLLRCEGGPSIGRATTYPPPLEIAVDGGVYVLVDDGPVETWHYSFIEEPLSS